MYIAEIMSNLAISYIQFIFPTAELDDVKDRLARTRNKGQYVPLRLFRSRGKNVINVTDISQGLWCEVQVEYKHLHPTMKRTAEWSKMAEQGTPVQLKTAGMKQGAAIHLKKGEQLRALVRELFVGLRIDHSYGYMLSSDGVTVFLSSYS